MGLAWAGWGPQQLSRGHGVVGQQGVHRSTEAYSGAELAGENAQEEEEEEGCGQGSWGLKD